MAAKQEGDVSEFRPRTVLVYLQVIVAFVAVAAIPGQWFVYREKQAQLDKKLDALEVSVLKHSSDKSIHVTEDQMRVVMQAQLAPVNATLAALSAKYDAQQSQLDRMERLLERLQDYRSERQKTSITETR